MVKSTKRILGVGNAITDVIVKTNLAVLESQGLKPGMCISAKNAKLKVNDKSEFPSGCAANTICGLANLGFETAFVGAIGDDLRGENYLTDLCKRGVEPLLDKREGDSGVVYCFLTPDNEPVFVDCLGVVSEFSIPYKKMFDFDVFYTSGADLATSPFNIMECIASAKRIKEQRLNKNQGEDMLIAFDLGNVSLVKKKFRLIDYGVLMSDIVFASEGEAKAYAKTDNLHKCLEALCLNGIGVLKMGKKGAFIKKGADKPIFIPSYDVDVVNTLGAGDAFAAGFLAGILNNYDIAHAGKCGAYYAAQVCTSSHARLQKLI